MTRRSTSGVQGVAKQSAAQYHMKLIFEKCGVASRGELLAKIFTEHVLANHKAATGHV